jgi:hypothetical protein
MTESDLRRLLDSLDACRASLHGRLHFWTWLVVIGVALEFISLVWEYVRELKDFKRGEIHAPEKPALPLYVTGFLGIAFVVAGVSGELYIDGQLGTVETAIRKANGDLLALISGEAGDAAKSAATAHGEADAVKLEADAIQKRLTAASTQLSVMEQQLRIQGPRWKLLETGKTAFIEALKPFSPQRVTVVNCGLTIAPEPDKFEQDLLNLLGKQGAGWAVESPGYATWNLCGVSTFGGTLVIVNSAANGSVKTSARALHDILNKLEINTNETQAATPDLQFWMTMGADSPWVLAAKDPTAVVLLVGPNAMQEPPKPK